MALGTCVVPVEATGQASPEEIFIARSVRESRAAPTAFCSPSRAGFDNAQNEDRYTLRSIITSVDDGRVLNASAKKVGDLRACFGSTPNPQVLNFYVEAALESMTFRGRGECHYVRTDYPEAGLTVTRCWVDLFDISNGFIGGQLTANSIASRNRIGELSDPPGYTQPSIATIRLWRGQ